jgi:hypothetical protein
MAIGKRKFWYSAVPYPAFLKDIFIMKLCKEFMFQSLYPIGTRDLFVEVKRPDPEVDHSHSFSAEVNAWSYTSTPKYALMAW